MLETKKRDTFIFYRSFYEAVKELPKENQVNIYNAIFEYIFEGKEPILKGIEKTIWILSSPVLKANEQRFINGNKPKQNKSKPQKTGSKTEAKEKQTISEIKAKPEQPESKTEAYKYLDKYKDLDKYKNTSDNNFSLKEPIKEKKIKKKKIAVDYENYPAFISFWEIYKHGSKQEAFTEYLETKDNFPIDIIIKHLELYFKNNPAVNYRKHGCRYIKTRLWETPLEETIFNQHKNTAYKKPEIDKENNSKIIKEICGE